MDYIEKMQEMLKEEYSMEEVAENLYLNYHSVMDTDLVYKLRKAIALKYQCDLNDVKLIGSSHTGYTYKDGNLIKRDNPKDYDFAIINSQVFVEFFHMVKLDKICGDAKKKYTNGILQGKIHPKYADRQFRDKLEILNREIMNELKVAKHITICFYLSEKDFIKGLVKYNQKLYTGELKKIRDSGETTLTVGIGQLFDFSALKGIEKLED